MGSTASLPRGAALLRAYSPAVGALPPDRIKAIPTGKKKTKLSKQPYVCGMQLDGVHTDI